MLATNELIQIPTAYCSHCGNVLPTRPIASKFCCAGCASVYSLLHEEGLSGYYSLLRQNPPACALPAKSTSNDYGSLNDENLISGALIADNCVEFFVEGLNCSACLWLIEKLPQLCQDVENARVDMSRSVVRVKRKNGGSFANAAQMLDRIGYRPVLVKNSDETELLFKNTRRRELIRLGVAGAITGNIMILAVAGYAGISGELAQQFKYLSSFLSLPILTYCSLPFYKSAFAALRTRAINIDLPIVAAILVGALVSFHGLLAGNETLYFDSLSTLVFLLLSSRFLLASIQRHYFSTSHLEDELFSGKFTRISKDGSRETISAQSISKSNHIEITKGQSIPADGIVLLGSAQVDASSLTGESAPTPTEVGQRVEAGCRVVNGTILILVIEPPATTRLAGILRDADAMTKSKPKFEKFADRVGQYFIAVVFAIAIATVLYFAQTDFSVGLNRALALIIVTCPCVFGMAIPLSMALAVREAARNGIIIKDADVLERVLKVKRIHFDKTGTLTSGQLRVVRAHDYTPNGFGFAVAAALERNQTHVVANAILDYTRRITRLELRAEYLNFSVATGLSGTINGVEYSIRPLGLVAALTQKQSTLNSKIGVFRDLSLLAEFEIADEIRAESKTLLEWFRKENIQTGLVSGDRASVVAVCGDQLGFKPEDIVSQATPEQKAALVKNDGIFGAMVGDGANDAAALAAASVGIAMRGSMDVSLRAADVYLTKQNLGSVNLLFEIAANARRGITRNLLFSATFNLLSGSLAVTGHMTPLWAAVLMPLSSTVVLISALRAANVAKDVQ